MSKALPWIVLAAALAACAWFLTDSGDGPGPVAPVETPAAAKEPAPAPPLAAAEAPARDAVRKAAETAATDAGTDPAEADAAPAVPPETPARLHGVATEGNGTPLHGWRVVALRIEDADSGHDPDAAHDEETASPQRITAEPDEDGNWTMPEVPAGAWDVQFERGGFGRLRAFPALDEPLVLAPGEDRFLPLVLEPGPLTLTGRIGMERAFSGMGVVVELRDEHDRVLSRFLSAIDWDREDRDGAFDDDHDRPIESTEGAFRIPGLRPGRYRLVFPPEGIAPLEGTEADGSPVAFRPEAFDLVVDLASDRDLGRIVVHWADYFSAPRAKELARLLTDAGAFTEEEVVEPPTGAPPPPHSGGPRR